MWRRALRPRWIIGAVLVMLAVPVMIRLGFWQLDRLEQRRTFNARVLAQIDAPQMPLDASALQMDLYNMEFRHVTVTGEYDHAQQVVLRNQAWNGRAGLRLLTPMHIESSDAVVLVERGWIPAEDEAQTDWAKYDEPGMVTVQGMLHRPEDVIGVTNFTAETDESGRQLGWLSVDIAGLQMQMEYDLLPVYVSLLPEDETDVTPPIPTESDIEVTEGPHLGYAFQWFTFATIAGLGFPLFLYRELRKEQAEENVDMTNEDV